MREEKFTEMTIQSVSQKKTTDSIETLIDVLDSLANGH